MQASGFPFSFAPAGENQGRRTGPARRNAS
jgi:hypothetical protein